MVQLFGKSEILGRPSER